ncbi:hypothetical protein RF11_12392 [Thelohanellus kitauei]|uniref:Uncharacterized protein n=1 Tax=Thelohanellus kitauei TaxID=669202 RepID=A0A0C2MN59_THEKT|nr:hypothetical protein RF11_12392 [Thelohanellus kitauei]
MAFIIAEFNAYLKTKRIFFRIGRTIPTQTEKANEHVRQTMSKNHFCNHFCVGFPITGITSCLSVASANGEVKTTSKNDAVPAVIYDYETKEILHSDEARLV